MNKPEGKKLKNESSHYKVNEEPSHEQWECLGCAISSLFVVDRKNELS